jgi:adenosylcobinamide kinase/adenosylcobinamide-phosphate guanylyltransferase
MSDNRPAALILILGGVRSGKSAYAEQLAAQYGPHVLYIATGEAHDEEMRERIHRHQADRPPAWHTLEAPLEVAAQLTEVQGKFDALLLDCMTLLISNLLLSKEGERVEQIEAAAAQAVQALLAAHQAFSPPAPLIIVSNEVGMGVVPPYPLGRLYRDLLGRVNQQLARRADRVIFMLAGLPMELSVVRD